jgi:hypothetical protein
MMVLAIRFWAFGRPQWVPLGFAPRTLGYEGDEIIGFNR